MGETGRRVYMNGSFVPESEARISIYDSALMFGDVVFEMTRSFAGKQFLLREHLARLYRGVKQLRIRLAEPPDEMERLVERTMEENAPAFEPHDEHRIPGRGINGPVGIVTAGKRLGKHGIREGGLLREGNEISLLNRPTLHLHVLGESAVYMNPESLKICTELGVAHPAVPAVAAAHIWCKGDAHTLLVSLNL